jgi:hypothetical protein
MLSNLGLTVSPASLKLEGTDAQNHEVFTELKRIQQYFGKIKTAEEPEASRNVTVNQEATARVLKANLVRSRRALCNGKAKQNANSLE